MSKKDLKGLGGWLILYAVGLILMDLLNFSGVIGGILTKNIFLLFPLIIYSLFYLWITTLFFNKQKLFVKVTIILLWIGIISGILLVSLGFLASLIHYIEDSSSYLLMMILILVFINIAWLQYFKESIRVKNTFVN